MSWMLLFSAGLLEVVWAYFLKRSAGISAVVPSLIAVVTMIASVVLLSLSLRSIPLGVAYAVWTGIGALGALLVGILLLGEPIGLLRGVAFVLILAGVVLMRLSGGR